VTETTADPRANEKRRRIIEAAWRLALKQGLRGVTMEALAREASVAKGTLYAHFSDKDAVFDGVVADLLVELAAAFDRGMAGEGAVAERIGAALAGKYDVIARAIEGSPHAGEILDAHHRYAPRVAAFDRRVEDEVAAALAKAGVAEPGELARVVVGAAGGVARALPGVEASARAIRLICLRLIEPAIPSPRAPSAP
jgi:AcrR family transcriptional regulator